MLGIDSTSERVGLNEPLTWTLTLSNPTLADVSGLVVRAVVPDHAGYSFNGTTVFGIYDEYVTPPPYDWSGNARNGYAQGTPLEWRINSLPRGQTRSLTLRALAVTNGVGSPPFGKSMILRAEALLAGNRVAGGEHAVLIDEAPVFDMAVVPGTSIAAGGETVDFKVVYTSVADAPVAGTVLSLSLPPGMELLGADAGYGFAGGKLSWGVGTLNPGKAETRHFQARIATGLADGAQLRVPALITGNAGKPGGASATVTVNSARRVVLTLDSTSGRVGLNEPFTWTLTLSNPTLADVSGLVVQAMVPDLTGYSLNGTTVFGIYDEYVTPPPYDWSGNGRNGYAQGTPLEWRINSLPKGQTRSFTLRAYIAENFPGRQSILTARVISNAMEIAAVNHSVALVNLPLNQGPAIPSITFPAAGVTGVQSAQLIIRASAFSDSENDAHLASQWIIRRADDNIRVHDSGEISSLKEYAVPAGVLEQGFTYTAQVRYRDMAGEWSNYSAPSEFSLFGPARDLLFSRNANGTLAMDFKVPAGLRYKVESSDQVAAGWTPLTGVEGGDGNASVKLPAPSSPRRFYRVSTHLP